MGLRSRPNEHDYEQEHEYERKDEGIIEA